MARNGGIPVAFLGQSGIRLQLGSQVLYFDPYLTDAVAHSEGADLARMLPAPMRPEQASDANWIFVTHLHLDHCDVTTLGPMMQAAPQATLVGPNVVVQHLRGHGIAPARLRIADQGSIIVGEGTAAEAVPACHPAIRRDDSGHLECVGYVIGHEGRRIYHAGDTSPHEDIVAAVRGAGSVDVAFLPVNERNYYRERRGIIGNMSLREAFQFGDEIGARTVVPIHWDLFGPNCVYREEIELLHRLIAPRCALRIYPSSV